MDQLQEQVARLGAENVQLRARLADYESIRGEAGLQPSRVVVARGRIVSRSRRAGRRFLQLDVGRAEGIEKGMAACAGWGVVGRIIGTDDGRCLVQEVTDGESRVTAALVDPVRGRLCEGLLLGQGRPGTMAYEPIEVGPDLPVKPGLVIVTAGGDGRFPAGMPVGTVVSADHGGGERWRITVAPLRDAATVESLLVVHPPAP